MKMSSKPPHIILILSDEHRGQAMTHAGDPNLRTPNMDRLAAEGAGFRRAYANCPICTPSRGTIFSGRHAHSGPVSGFFDVYKATAPSLATELREAGYHTAYFGKWHCGTVRDQLPPAVRADPDSYRGCPVRTNERHRAGFQDWFGFENINHHFASYHYRGTDENPTFTEGYETDGLTELVMDYVEKYDREEPLCLVLSVTPPHFPLDVPGEWLERFHPGQMEVRPNFEDTEFMRDCLSRYYAMIENLDWNIGRLGESLRELPTFVNTLTLYTSDHGDLMGSHGRQSRKDFPQEEAVRVPAIFHWPGKIPGGLNPQGLFSLVDLMPTLLGLAGVSAPAHMQGFDWSKNLLGGEAKNDPSEVLLEMVGNPRWTLDFTDWRGMVTDRWKYAFYETGEEALFDLRTDPFEMDNLALRKPEECGHWRERLKALMLANREPYFDVLMEYGKQMNPPSRDVSKPMEEGEHPGLKP